MFADKHQKHSFRILRLKDFQAPVMVEKKSEPSGFHGKKIKTGKMERYKKTKDLGLQRVLFHGWYL